MDKKQRESHIYTTQKIKETILLLHTLLKTEYKCDFIYLIGVNGKIISASSNEHGYISPITNQKGD